MRHAKSRPCDTRALATEIGWTPLIDPRLSTRRHLRILPQREVLRHWRLQLPEAHGEAGGRYRATNFAPLKVVGETVAGRLENGRGEVGGRDAAVGPFGGEEALTPSCLLCIPDSSSQKAPSIGGCEMVRSRVDQAEQIVLCAMPSPRCRWERCASTRDQSPLPPARALAPPLYQPLYQPA